MNLLGKAGYTKSFQSDFRINSVSVLLNQIETDAGMKIDVAPSNEVSPIFSLPPALP